MSQGNRGKTSELIGFSNFALFGSNITVSIAIDNSKATGIEALLDEIELHEKQPKSTCLDRPEWKIE